MAKKTPDDPNGFRPDQMRKMMEILQKLSGAAESAQPRLPQLTRDQAFEYFKLQSEERHSARLLLAGAVCFLGVLGLCLCWMALAYGHPELITDLAKVFAGLAVGFAGGYGVRAAAKPRRGDRVSER